MSRYLLIVELDPGLGDVEPYKFAGRIEDSVEVASVLVMPIEDGDQIVKMSTVTLAIGSFHGEQAGADVPDMQPDDDLAELSEIARYAQEHGTNLGSAWTAVRAEDRARRDLALADRITAQQAERRDELESFDRAAELRRAARLAQTTLDKDQTP